MAVVDAQWTATGDHAATAAHVTFSQKLHYWMNKLDSRYGWTHNSSELIRIVLETWYRLVYMFALPDAIRQVSFLTQLFGFKFRSRSLEHLRADWKKTFRLCSRCDFVG